MMETSIKASLLADRYATTHQGQKSSNHTLATQLQQELPTALHLPLTELYKQTDTQVKLKGTTQKAQNHQPLATHLDKDTTRALTALHPKNPYTHPHRPPHQPATQQYQHPNSNYKGKNFDANYVHPNAANKPLTTRPPNQPTPQQWGNTTKWS